MEYTKHQYNKKICANCGKNGHEFRGCTDPITSYGIINIKITDENNGDIFKQKFSKKDKVKYLLASKKYNYVSYDVSNNISTDENNISYKIDNESINLHNMDEQIEKFCYYKQKVLFLMVSRKFSVGFIDFVRGKYDIHNSSSIIRLFEHMTQYEILYIRDHSYDEILYHFLNKKDEPMKDVLSKIYEGKYSNEYCEAKIKFNLLTDANEKQIGNIPWNMNFYVKNVKPKWSHPEWGFPKGRRDKNTEENLNCACREFEEETGYDHNNYKILNKIEPIDEYLLGTNNINYKYVYYIALDMNKDQIMNEYDTHEIDEVKWFTFDEAIKLIRPNHVEKKSILTKIYMFIINYLIWHDEFKE